MTACRVTKNFFRKKKPRHHNWICIVAERTWRYLAPPKPTGCDRCTEEVAEHRGAWNQGGGSNPTQSDNILSRAASRRIGFEPVAWGAADHHSRMCLQFSTGQTFDDKSVKRSPRLRSPRPRFPHTAAGHCISIIREWVRSSTAGAGRERPQVAVDGATSAGAPHQD